MRVVACGAGPVGHFGVSVVHGVEEVLLQPLSGVAVEPLSCRVPWSSSHRAFALLQLHDLLGLLVDLWLEGEVCVLLLRPDSQLLQVVVLLPLHVADPLVNGSLAAVATKHVALDLRLEAALLHFLQVDVSLDLLPVFPALLDLLGNPVLDAGVMGAGPAGEGVRVLRVDGVGRVQLRLEGTVLLNLLYLLLRLDLVPHEDLVVLGLDQLLEALLLRLFLLGAKGLVYLWLEGVLLAESSLALRVDLLGLVVCGRSALRDVLLEVVADGRVVELGLHVLIQRVLLRLFSFLSPDRELVSGVASDLLPRVRPRLRLRLNTQSSWPRCHLVVLGLIQMLLRLGLVELVDMLLLVEALKMRKVGVLLLQQHLLLNLLSGELDRLIGVILLLGSVEGLRIEVLSAIQVLIRNRLCAHVCKLEARLVHLRCQLVKLHLRLRGLLR